ncbi:molybdopterin-dependent oxidoreductase [Microaerobacter geothermalis]|uniref:molybdopterin-dependent oxidoreductase n=1 Tax=Microaerobacter geothermalis TaxID=674972 RepID=UPI001F1C1AA3|nr:molybdopterin-dependent oxidoreductase [Microaerobacter geothermalis]MCF6092937.1 molybdopterin-dependent oxidoreductase [Microaerobacter geothermalis]
MNNRKVYRMIHWIHGMLLFTLLITGAILYLPLLRTLFFDFRWEIRQYHSMLGIFYFLFVFTATPYVIQYMRMHAWKKTFHICLHITLALGWTASGVYLWVNDSTYLGIRQLSITIHDGLSLFIIPWVIAHVGLWYARKKGLFRSGIQTSPSRGHTVRNWDRAILLTRRDVIIFFTGGLLSLILGGLFRWVQPVSKTFLASIETVKKRGYFRIYSVRSENPVFDPNSWKLDVGGLVEKPMEFSFDELMRLPKHQYTYDFYCVTGWSVTGVKWEGIPFLEIVKMVNPKSEGKYVTMYSADRLYWETYELSQLMNRNVILAYKLDGKDLIASQGAPLRLFHPGMYGYKSIKWVNRIEFTDQRDLGYWEEKEGYDLNGYIT